jgi:2-hydroxychromene-2-carboxylate isomerase
VLLGGLFKAAGASQNPGGDMGPAKARLNLADQQRFAALRGVELAMPAAHPRRSVEAMRLLVAAPEEKRPGLTHALFRAYWVEGLDVADRAVLGRLAQAQGVAPALIDAETSKAALFAETEAAARRGLFGVPSFGVGDRFFWGQDRMHFVEAALTGRKPRYAEPVSDSGSGATVTFFHDFSSPFSYLASTQVERAFGPTGATVVSRPILLGALFKEIGTVDVPLQAMSPPRRQYFARDLHDWAEWWDAPFRFTDHFPLRTVQALRVAIAEPALTPALYRAAWVENRDLGRPDVLGEIIAETGREPGPLLLRAAEDTALKARLRENTEAAKAAGACGVPTFLIERPGEELGRRVQTGLYWGQDRFELMLHRLAEGLT